MTTHHRHDCGAQLESRLETTTAGLAHRIEFIEPGSRERVTRCPGCRADLSAALRDGQLRPDATPRRPEQETQQP